VRPKTQQVPRWFHHGFLALAALFLYLDLFIFPAIPIAGTDHDQSFYLHNAARMLDGQMIYRDFFQFTPPGTELVYLGLFKLFGVRAWIPNATLVVLGFGLTWLCLTISKKIWGGLLAYLPPLMFLVLSFYPATDGSHHWFSMIAAIAALALIVAEVSVPRLIGAGMLCGVASFFTQPRGFCALLGLATYILWKYRKTPHAGVSSSKMVGILAATFAGATVGFNLYFIYKAGIQRFWWCTVTFGLKYYPAESTLNSFRAYLAYPPMLPHVRHIPEPGWAFIHALIPLVYLVFFVSRWRKAKEMPQEQWDRLMLVSLVGFSLFLGIAPAPISWRMYVIALPALIVFVSFLDSARTPATLVRGLFWTATGAAMVIIAWNHQTRWRALLDTPTGRVAIVEPAAYEKYWWIAAHTHPGEPFFDCSGQSYFLLGLRSPAVVSFLSGTDYMRPEQVQDLVGNLESHRVHVVLWCSDLNVATRPDDHLGPLRAYLRANYHVAETSGDMQEILVRNGDPSSP
jgi:hypothetical protein